MSVPQPSMLLSAISILQTEVHQTAIDRGWWEGEDRNPFELIALVHAELSEAVEVLRVDPSAASVKVPVFSALEEELADAVIRILDMSEKMELDIAGAIVSKNEYNKGREYRHGNKRA